MEAEADEAISEPIIGIVTLMFSDIEGSTRLLQHLGFDSYSQLLADHHRLMRAAIGAHGGREVKTEGDSFFAVFREPSEAIGAVVQAQRAFHAQKWPQDIRVAVRIGIHTGSV